MTLTQRQLRSEDLAAALTAIGVYDAPVDGCLRAIYTRQPLGVWTFYNGQCALGEDAQSAESQVYQNFAFVSKALRGLTIKALLESLVDTGIEMKPGLPPLRISLSALTWTEELVPTYATRSQMPSRRLTVSATTGAFFPESQLIDFTLPYRPSAARYAKDFLGLKANDSVDARRGQFTIEIPETRGAIRFAGGLISIRDPAMPLRLVGTINGDIPIDVRNDTTTDYDEKTVREVELWLLTKDGEVVDYISTTDWAHKYETPLPETEQAQKLLELIRKGESEICEFKPHIDLEKGKASEIEKTVCAFSNQCGGTLFIGVTDEGDIVGLARDLAIRPEDLDNALANYEMEVRTRLREILKDNQCFNSRVAAISGTRVIIIEVQSSREINYIVKSDLAQMAYIRHGATNMKLSPPELKAKIEGAPRSMFGDLML